MAIDIVSRYDSSKVLHSVDADTLRGASLYGADLYGADLYEADLREADLRGADLYGADLRGADLYGADLYGADLYEADLGGANLGGANLRGADLRGADLYGADLYGADLGGADLSGASLSGASLSGASLRGTKSIAQAKGLQPYKSDIWAVLTLAPREAAGVLEALRAGRVNGTLYTGPCACLIGTIANLRHCDYTDIPGLAPDSSRPAEIWFTNIRPRDTPESSEVVALTVQWIEEWFAVAGNALVLANQRPAEEA